MVKKEIFSSGKFKSSFRISYYDKKGNFTNGLFANKKQAKNWCKRNKFKKCNLIK